MIQVGPLNTALPSKQEKYFITHLHAWSMRWSMQKITKSDAKRNLRFLSTKVLQGSVATCVNCGRIIIDSFTANLLQSVIVEEF